LRKEDAAPLADEEKLNIGEMDLADKELVIALLRQYPEIMNKKPGCPPLTNTEVQHHINTGDATPIMLPPACAGAHHCQVPNGLWTYARDHDGRCDGVWAKATAELLKLMHAKQATSVPYRPNLLGLVERFHRTWKDMVNLYVDEEQDDWDDFVPCALYAHNSSPHATHGFQPNGLMLGRKLQTPAALCRSRLVHPHRKLEAYHEMLLQDLRTARQLAALALQKEQARQAMYYNQRNVRLHAPFQHGKLVWVYRPARAPKITKFGHRWRGRAQFVEAAGYDNYWVRMLATGKELVTHCSFLLSYYYATHMLHQMAKDIALDLREEAVATADIDSEDEEPAAVEAIPAKVSTIVS
jgi:hypothetical protein